MYQLGMPNDVYLSNYITSYSMSKVIISYYYQSSLIIITISYYLLTATI